MSTTSSRKWETNTMSDGTVEQTVERLVGAEYSSDSEEILLGDDEDDNND